MDEIDAYKAWSTFVASVEKILREFGKNYVINFVWLLIFQTKIFFQFEFPGIYW